MKDVEPQSIKKGIITNILSPHHYIFWATVGTPIILEGLETSLWTGISFVIVFFSSLVGTKIGVSVLVAKYKNVLKNKWYLYLIKFLGLILIFFAFQIPEAKIDTAIKSQIPEDMPSRLNIEKIEDLFGGTEIIMVGLKTDDVLDKTTLKRVKQ